MQKLPIKIDRGNLLFRLSILTRHWRQVLDSEFQASELTAATWRPLLHLRLLGDGIRQKDLAAAIGIEGPSIVRLLDTLLKMGLIKRAEDVTDRRAKLLYLTQKGQLLVDRIQETVMSLERDLLGTLSDDEISQFGDLILKLESTIYAARLRSRK